MNQTSKPYEIIIQDDSFDKAEIKKIDKVISRYKNIKFARNSKNLGLAANVNRTIMKAKGDYVVIVNNDDRISLRYIEEIQEFVKVYPNFKAYTTNACAISDNGKVFGDYRLFTKNTVIKKGKGISHLWNNYFLNLITVSGATIYKRRHIQENLFKTKYGNEADLDNSLRLLSSQDIMYIDIPIYFVGINNANTSKVVRSTTEKLDAHVARCLNIYENYRSRFKATPLYMARPKSVYFLQLFFKYHYSFRKIKSLLRLNNWLEILPLAFASPTFFFVQLKQRVLFHFYKSSYKKYFPTIKA